MIRAEIREVLEGAPLAHLATVRADGSPHVVPVFVGIEGGHIAIFTGPQSVKARNLRRDPRVALSIAPAENPFTPIVIRGRVAAWVDGAPGWQVVDRIAAKYLGQAYPRDLERVVALIEPITQTVGVG